MERIQPDTPRYGIAASALEAQAATPIFGPGQPAPSCLTTKTAHNGTYGRLIKASETVHNAGYGRVTQAFWTGFGSVLSGGFEGPDGHGSFSFDFNCPLKFADEVVFHETFCFVGDLDFTCCAG